MKKKELTLEDIGKMLQDLQKKVEEQNRKVSTTYIPPVIVQGGCHGHCHQCHPQQFQPWYQPYTIMCNNESVLNAYNIVG